jgi:hypothetical protein
VEKFASNILENDIQIVNLAIILRGFLVDILRGHAKSSECPE